MQEAALRKSQKPYEGLSLCRARVDDVAAADQPDARCTERDTKRLMPPPTPEARHALVEHVDGEAAVDARVVPQLGTRAEKARAEDEVAKHVPQGHDEVDCDEDGHEADEAAVGKQDGWWEAGQIGRESLGRSGGDLCGEFGTENEVRVLHHEDREKVQHKVLDEHWQDFCAKPLAAGLVTAISMTRTEWY